MKRITQVQPIRAGTAAPHGDSSTYGDVQSVRAKLQNTSPKGVETAGDAYLTAAETLRQTVMLLESVADSMAGRWQGGSARQAQQALRLLHASARELSAKARQVGAAHTHYAYELRKAKANLPDSGTFTFDDDMPAYLKVFSPLGIAIAAMSGKHESDNDRARRHLEELNDQIRSVYNRLPAAVTTVLPDPGPPMTPALRPPAYPKAVPAYPTVGHRPARPGGPETTRTPTHGPGEHGPERSRTTTHGTGEPDGGTGPPGGGTHPGNGTGTGGPGLAEGTPYGVDPNGRPGQDDPRRTGLAGLRPSGLTTPPSPSPGAPPGPATTAPDALPPLITPPGLGGTPLNSPGPLTTAPVSGPVSGGGNGGTPHGAVGPAPGAAGPAAGGMPFMPMGGGTGGEGGQERERSTWLIEDESVWGGDGPVAPEIIC